MTRKEIKAAEERNGEMAAEARRRARAEEFDSPANRFASLD